MAIDLSKKGEFEDKIFILNRELKSRENAFEALKLDENVRLALHLQTVIIELNDSLHEYHEKLKLINQEIYRD